MKCSWRLCWCRQMQKVEDFPEADSIEVKHERRIYCNTSAHIYEVCTKFRKKRDYFAMSGKMASHLLNCVWLQSVFDNIPLMGLPLVTYRSCWGPRQTTQPEYSRNNWATSSSHCAGPQHRTIYWQIEQQPVHALLSQQGVDKRHVQEEKNRINYACN